MDMINPDTLNILVENRRLTMQGKGRGVWYRIAVTHTEDLAKAELPKGGA